MIALFNKLIHYYSHHLKLQKKLLISHLILVLFPFTIITLLFYTQLFNIIVSNTKETELSKLRETVTNIESVLSVIHTASDEFLHHESLDHILNSEYKITDNIESLPIDNTHSLLPISQETYDQTNQYTKALLNKENNSYISNVRLYLDERYAHFYNHDILNKNNIFQPIDRIDNSYWHGIFSSTNSRLLYSPTLYLSNYEKNNLGNLALTRKISDPWYDETAYLSIYFNKYLLTSELRSNISLLGSANYMLDDRDTLIASSNNSLAGKYLLRYDDIKSKIFDSNKYINMNFSGESCYVTYMEIGSSNWIIVNIIPTSSMWSDNTLIITKFLLAYVVIIIFTFIISIKLSNSIVYRLSSVITTMNHVKFGELTPILHSKEFDEIGQLKETYNYMIEEIQHLSEEKLRNVSELRTAELKALQSQINPHFLYNTLDMIHWLGKKGLGDEVSSAVQILSKFYKMTLNKDGVISTIEDEIKHASLYMQLQNMRYDNKIEYTFDIPDYMLDYTIPKITLQPLLENAIKHGILAKESKEGSIVVTGWLEGNDLLLIIYDNGIGMEPLHIKDILLGQYKSVSGSGVAIYNIHLRLQLYYNTNFGLSYESKEGEYTQVTIRIPAKINHIDTI